MDNLCGARARSAIIGLVQLRITSADGRRLRTVTISAPRGTTWATTLHALGLSPSSDLVVEYAGGTLPLAPDHILGLPPLVHGVTVRPGSSGDAPGPRPPVSVVVTSGPDAGGSFRLRPGGRVSIGRGQWCDIVVDDPGLSRHHLTISTTREGILVEDADSTNGTVLDGIRISGPTTWPPGVALRAGSTTLGLTPEDAVIPRGQPDGDGLLVVAPRDFEPPPIASVSLRLPELTLPAAPTPPSALGWSLPLLVSILLALVLSMPALMLFGLMAPAMSLGSHAGERRRHRRELATARSQHEQTVTAVHDAARRAVEAEARCRDERAPALAHLVRAAARTGPQLWSRAGAAPLCRLGLGEIDTSVVVDGVLEQESHLPVEINLTGGLALVGPADLTRAAARSVLLQLAVLHPPGTLRIEVAGACHRQRDLGGSQRTWNPDRWEWLAWLPHARTDRGFVAPETTVIRLHDRSGQTGPDPGPTTAASVPIFLCHTEAEAPDCTTVVTLHGSRMMIRSAGREIVGIPDLLASHRALSVARLLAPLTDGAVHQGDPSIPDRVEFAAVAPLPILGPAVAEGWRRAPRSTQFVLGRGAGATVSLDLASDGPHALVAGTTGAGKSELLRTLVTSLALVNRPDELVMVLVDYKGGSAFAEAAGLPHVVGVITDLDPHLADRALTSLTAELKRRERILADAGAADLPAYQGMPGREPLPRLVLVIDEFRALAEELPGFLDGLVRIAALGRSLGVHLVLATQRPGGVVSADVRANVNLRIALRVRDSSDSYDVIDSPAAADLPERLPGRALVRTGAGAPRAVQVASTSTVPSDPLAGSDGRVLVREVDDLWASDDTPVPDRATGGSPEGGASSALARVAVATTEAAALLGAVAPPSPWLPALPDLIPLDHLRTGHATAPGGTTEFSVPLLLADLPATQAQPVHSWRPLAEGHLGIVGAGRMGRSTVARTVLAGLLSTAPADVHLYAFDLAGSLGPLAGAPQVGAVLTAGDVARGCRVIEHLTHLVAARQRDLAAGGHTSLTEQRCSGDRPWPLVVLMIDGWPRFAELFGEVDRGRPLDQVLQLLREGQGVGLTAVVTGDRSLLGGRIAALVPELWALRLTDPSDLLMAGLSRAQVPVSMPPGRVIRLRDGVVGQVAVVGAAAEGAAQVTALARVVSEAATRGGSAERPRAFRALPRAVELADLAQQGQLCDGLVVGVGGDAATPVEVPVGDGTPRVFGVVGPPGSGRTTTLRALKQSAAAHGWRTVDVGETHVHNPESLRAELAPAEPGSGVLVLVDGLDRVSQQSAEDLLLDWLDAPGQPDHPAPPRLLVVSGGPDDVGGFRGLGARVARERHGIILQPRTATDGAPLGVSVTTGDDPVPGRGVLVLRGRCTAVQVGLPQSF